MKCESCHGTRNVHLYILDQDGNMAAVCTQCEETFWASPPSMMEEPYALLTENVEESYKRYLPYKQARDSFRQSFDPTLSCHRKNRDNRCTNEVAEYYFSDGSTLPLCTSCVRRDDIPVCMRDGAYPISTQYYREVYGLIS